MGAMQVLIIVQARMNSERLPGKVLKEVLGRPLLSYLLERLRAVPNTEIIVATTTEPEDDAIASLCQQEKVKVFRGSQNDVLERYYKAATEHHGKVIIRVTGDCPCIDPKVIQQVIQFYLKNDFDYVSNTIEWTFPRGMDVEVFSYEVLEKVYQEAKTPPEREHVTLNIYTHPEKFTLGNYARTKDVSQYRLTVDTEEDFQLIKRMIENLYPDNPKYTLDDMIALLEKKPEWAQLNSHIKQKKI
jgi:spore coat polysaccharide biosynthesis protein SpsF